jgi:nucleoside-diphosphate-sugar epimerase
MAQRPIHYPHMSVLLVGPSAADVGGPLALLAEALGAAGRTVVRAGVPEGQTEAFALCRGVETIVLAPATADAEGGRAWLDSCTRGTYDLLCAAAEASVQRVVVLSTLDLFLAYPAAFKVGADWRPRPSTVPAQLGPHLAEFVAREFARGSHLCVAVVRLGHVGDAAQRFWIAADAVAAQLVKFVTSPGPVDIVPTHHHPGKYRVLHLLDPACEFLPAGERVDVVAAAAAVAAAPAAVPVDSIKKVLLLGANGMLGPPVVNELGDTFALAVTDLNPYGWRASGDKIVAGTGSMNSISLAKPLADFAMPCEEALLNVADATAVAAATAAVDATVNCAVLRPHPKLAFDVNTTGTYNAIAAAVASGHSRFVNTGPHHTVIGYLYEDYDFGVSAEVPPHPGLDLYSLSKGCGQEICRVFAENHPIHVLLCLFLNFKRSDEPERVGEGTNPHSVTFPDAARCVRAMLEVDLAALPSRCETFFCTTDLPHGRYSNQKAKAILGWEPRDKLEGYYLKPAAARL